MDRVIKQYIRNCYICSQTKPSREKYYGVLHPLPPPQRPWTHVSMDLITGLPKSKEGHNAIFMVVDRLTKMRHIIPYSTNAKGGTTLDAIA